MSTDATRRAPMNGGTAFPVPDEGNGWGAAGMSLRDYFAIHADQPGVAEIVAAAGLVYSDHKVWSDPMNFIGTFDQWWRELPQNERFRLYAVVRYGMADAMLEARATGESS